MPAKSSFRHHRHVPNVVDRGSTLTELITFKLQSFVLSLYLVYVFPTHTHVCTYVIEIALLNAWHLRFCTPRAAVLA